jgi:GrpB-like predicted nucleotidyltransferase (UPF0157 family)
VVGSTAVQGLAGKPVLDTGVAVANVKSANGCIKPMVALGYTVAGPQAMIRRGVVMCGMRAG